MFTDNDQTELENEAASDPADDAREESLRWLLDMELVEPEEKLFGLAEEAYLDEGLTDYEAEVAARPLVRGADPDLSASETRMRLETRALDLGAGGKPPQAGPGQGTG